MSLEPAELVMLSEHDVLCEKLGVSRSRPGVG